MRGFAQAVEVVVLESSLDGGHLVGRSGCQRLAHFGEKSRLATASGQKAGCVNYVPRARSLRRLSANNVIDDCQKICRADGFGMEVIHAGCQTALAVFLPRPGR